jgi:nucleoside-diphosphate-sugar epimerase
LTNKQSLKIAVTGANGFVGTALCQKLLNDGHQVTALTRKPWYLTGICNRVVSDYKHPDLVNALNGHDCLFHLAAKTHSGTKATHKNLAAYRSINLELSEHLAKAAIAAGISRFIYLSSIKVNGEQTFDHPFRHTDTPAPEDAYGISKLEAEQSLRVILSNTPTRLIIVRPPLIWCRNNLKGNLALLRKWVNWRIPLPFKGWNNRRNLISLENLCDFLSICTNHPEATGKIFLVSDGNSLNTAEIAALISNLSPHVISLPQKVYRFLSKLKISRKLYGNLEVDITHSSLITSWKPTKTY